MNNGIIIFSKAGESYIAMALSTDSRMGSASVIECVNENNFIQAFTSFTITGPSLEDYASPRTNIVSLILRSVLHVKQFLLYVGPKHHPTLLFTIGKWKYLLLGRT